MKRPIVIKNCSSCLFVGGESATWCNLVTYRSFSNKMDVDKERPNWCPLPILIKGE